MENSALIVKSERRIMSSDSSDVVKMHEMQNLRDHADSNGMMKKDDHYWTKLDRKRKKGL